MPRTSWLVLPLAALPPLLLLAAGASGAWIKWGAVSWIVALLLKIPVMVIFGAAAARLPDWPFASIAGLLSALTELGVALAIVSRVAIAMSLPDVLLFASAAGSTEALALFGWVLVAAAREKGAGREPAAESAESAVPSGESAAEAPVGPGGSGGTNPQNADAGNPRQPWLLQHRFFVERSVAWLGHLGSRSLATLALVAGAPLLGALAILTFAVTDGGAALYDRRGADWADPGTFARFMRLAFVVACVELVVLAAYLTWRVAA